MKDDKTAEFYQLKKQIEEMKEDLYETKMTAESAYLSLSSKSCTLGYKFDLTRPRTLNSKFNWLLINYWNNHPARYYMSDKYFFKYYIERKYGKGLTVPLLAVYDSAEEIDFDQLPRKFVLKRTLGGGAREVRLIDKSTDDLEKLRRDAEKWTSGAYPQKARILAEEMLEFEGDNIVDYKFYVANGKAFLCMCGLMKKGSQHRQYIFYDLEWRRIKLQVSQNVKDISKPGNLAEMVSVAEKIGEDFPFVRVDIYGIKNKIVLGELTGVPFNACLSYEKYDYIWGGKLQLPSSEEIEENYEAVYDVFPELKESPVFLKGKNPDYKIVQPADRGNELPLPPNGFLQPQEKGQ